MNILFACESSGYPSELFATRGHAVTSCDLLPGKNIVRRSHIQADIFEVIPSQKWDAIIAFPPCTFLCRASSAHINSPGRRVAAIAAINFVKKIFTADCPLIAVENPIGFLNSNWSAPSQIIYPWQFGDNYSKDICLWLKGFPRLSPAVTVPGPGKLRPVSNHVNGRMSQTSKSEIKSSWKHFPNLSLAMANQWSAFLHSLDQGAFIASPGQLF